MLSMSIRAVGAYLRSLIESQSGLTIAGVSQAAGVKPNYIYRLETGDTKEPSARVLMNLVRAARGRVDHLERLLYDDSTEEMGRQLARAILDQGPPDEREQRRQQAIALIDSLLADPKKIDRLLGYGERLQEE